MMSDPLVVVLATAALIVLSALFVIVEFALLGVRRHRLEADAGRSRAVRAALRGIDELTLMLAGAQLGITLCTFALGAVTKPAVDAWLGPLLTGWGVPPAVAGTASFLLSLLAVTFLHLVVGEMAPKSWAIAHPETAARAVALPARAFVWAVRPLLLFANVVANRLVAWSGVTPVDRAAVGGYDAATIRQLVEHSAKAGTLDQQEHSALSGALDLETRTLGAVLPQGQRPVAVAADADVAAVQAAAVESGHLRILVHAPGAAGGAAAGPAALPGVVHVRDTLLMDAADPVAPVVQPSLALPHTTPLHEALAEMRRASRQLVTVTRDGRFVGVVTLTDVLRGVMPRSA